MKIFLVDFQQGGKYSAQIAIHQVELRREGKFNDQKYLSIIHKQTDYLNLDISSCLETIMREQILFLNINL